MRRRIALTAIVLGVCLSSTLPATLGASYTLSIPGSVETPPEAVTIKGETHHVTSIARTIPGGTLSVSVTAPPGETYRVYIYNGDRKITAVHRATGGQRISFNMTGYPPGSYLVTLYKNGDYKAVHPVVIQRYNVTLTSPTNVPQNSTLPVEITLTPITTAEPIHAVQVILTNGNQTVRATASRQSAQTYRTTLTLQSLPPGDARLYTVVQGTKTAFKDTHQSIIGISTPLSLTIDKQTTLSTTQSPTTTSRPTTPPTTSTKPTPRTSAPTPTSTPLPSVETESTSQLTPRTQSTELPTHTTGRQSTTIQTTVPDSLTHERTSTQEQTSAATTLSTMKSDPTQEILTPHQSTIAQTTTSSSTVPGLGFRSGIVACLCLYLLISQR